jgi:hypothetical protein
MVAERHGAPLNEQILLARSIHAPFSYLEAEDYAQHSGA